MKTINWTPASNQIIQAFRDLADGFRKVVIFSDVADRYGLPKHKMKFTRRQGVNDFELIVTTGRLSCDEKLYLKKLKSKHEKVLGTIVVSNKQRLA